MIDIRTSLPICWICVLAEIIVVYLTAGDDGDARCFLRMGQFSLETIKKLMVCDIIVIVFATVINLN